VPAFRKRLPKPGPWLLTFRKAMAVPMGLTAMALLWLLSRLSGQQGLLIGALSALAVLFVLVDRFRNSNRIGNSGLAAFALSLMIFSVAVKALPDTNEQSRSALPNSLRAEAFSETRLASLRAEGKPVFVYFTADWCVTCKVNEAAVLETPATAKLFADNGVTVLRGDFTRRDPEIARFLYRQQAVGVPLYLYYPKGGEAQKLPQLLTAATLADALGE
jgi:thiol:disulfide interchange protein